MGVKVAQRLRMRRDAWPVAAQMTGELSACAVLQQLVVLNACVGNSALVLILN